MAGAWTGFAHEYTRNGTTTLSAALDRATGLVRAEHYQRRRRRELLDFMNEIVPHRDSEGHVHVILDNLSTHKPKHDRWLARHKNVHFHFPATHASRLNRIEIWFGVLSPKALRGSSTSRLTVFSQELGDPVQARRATGQMRTTAVVSGAVADQQSLGLFHRRLSGGDAPARKRRSG